jgi:hypothetical protein
MVCKTRSGCEEELRESVTYSDATRGARGRRRPNGRRCEEALVNGERSRGCLQHSDDVLNRCERVECGGGRDHDHREHARRHRLGGWRRGGGAARVDRGERIVRRRRRGPKEERAQSRRRCGRGEPEARHDLGRDAAEERRARSERGVGDGGGR